MKIYKVCFSVEDGNAVRWAGSQSEVEEAKREMAELYSEGYCEYLTTIAVEIPTDKRGLLRWLNSNFDMDNG